MMLQRRTASSRSISQWVFVVISAWCRLVLK
uniref:Uncharacterized protein n=1 Tax=Triticum urartu TaxID=4572 RepID=A0A8R7UKM9_TRIUA